MKTVSILCASLLVAGTLMAQSPDATGKGGSVTPAVSQPTSSGTTKPGVSPVKPNPGVSPVGQPKVTPPPPTKPVAVSPTKPVSPVPVKPAPNTKPVAPAPTKPVA